MLVLAGFTDILKVSEGSGGLSVSAGLLLLKDPYASPKCYKPFTPREEHAGGRPALLLAYRDTPHWKDCKTVSSFRDGPFTVPFF